LGLFALVRACIDVMLLTQDDSYSAVGIKEEGISRNVGGFENSSLPMTYAGSVVICNLRAALHRPYGWLS